jgi:hypothetical protein
MSRLTVSPRGAGARLAALMMFGTLAGCTEPSGLAPTASPSAIIIIGGHPIVLTAQLRAIGNPDEKPLSAVVGHIQLKITGTVESGLVVDWQGHFANPECDASTDFGGGSVMIHDPENMPSPEDVAVLRLLPPGDPLGCGDNFLEGSSSISEELLALMIQDPENFVAAFFIIDGGVIAGTLQVAGAPVLETR